VLIGVLIGLLLAASFQAVTIAGESISLAMGLGFATMVDPQSGASVPVLSQFLLILTTLLFLSLGGHLMLIELIATSFETMPIAGVGLVRADLIGVAAFGSQMFAGAVLIALPAVVTLLVIQLAMGIMTRAAPQMNIFSVGFPITILLGFLVVLFFVLPVLQPRMLQLWGAAFGAARKLLGG
jgi:flagellar biosynthetic protein FliR